MRQRNYETLPLTWLVATLDTRMDSDAKRDYTPVDFCEPLLSTTPHPKSSEMRVSRA
jgi:hypothetical protein